MENKNNETRITEMNALAAKIVELENQRDKLEKELLGKEQKKDKELVAKRKKLQDLEIEILQYRVQRQLTVLQVNATKYNFNDIFDKYEELVKRLTDQNKNIRSKIIDANKDIKRTQEVRDLEHHIQNLEKMRYEVEFNFLHSIDPEDFKISRYAKAKLQKRFQNQLIEDVQLLASEIQAFEKNPTKDGLSNIRVHHEQINKQATELQRCIGKDTTTFWLEINVLSRVRYLDEKIKKLPTTHIAQATASVNHKTQNL